MKGKTVPLVLTFFTEVSGDKLFKSKDKMVAVQGFEPRTLRI